MTGLDLIPCLSLLYDAVFYAVKVLNQSFSEEADENKSAGQEKANDYVLRETPPRPNADESPPTETDNTSSSKCY